MRALTREQRLFILGFVVALGSLWLAGAWGVHRAEASAKQLEQVQTKRVFGPQP